MSEQQTNTDTSASSQPNWIRREYFSPFAFYRESIHCLDGALSEKNKIIRFVTNARNSNDNSPFNPLYTL